MDVKLENEKIYVKWEQLSGHKLQNAWIGLYEKSQKDNKQYLRYKNVNADEVILKSPIKPMDYEIRFFAQSYSCIAKESITIKGEDIIEATVEDGMIKVNLNVVSADPKKESVWIGLYKCNEENNKNYLKYKNLKDRKCLIAMKIPSSIQPDEYEIRLVDRDYKCLKKCNKFTLE